MARFQPMVDDELDDLLVVSGAPAKLNALHHSWPILVGENSYQFVSERLCHPNVGKVDLYNLFVGKRKLYEPTKPSAHRSGG